MDFAKQKGAAMRAKLGSGALDADHGCLDLFRGTDHTQSRGGDDLHCCGKRGIHLS